MRVISGEARGRKFLAPNVDTVRPTSDRVREAIFDVLGHLGGLAGKRVLDLFAGSGAFGIESLSRGASAVVFVDQEPKAITTIRENIAAVRLGTTGEIKVLQSDAIAFCRIHSDGRSTAALPGGRPGEPNSPGFDITFCDPPYAFSNWPKLLGVIPGELLVLESARPVDLPAHLEVYRVYRYGSTLITVANRQHRSDAEHSMAPEISKAPEILEST